MERKFNSLKVIDFLSINMTTSNTEDVWEIATIYQKKKSIFAYSGSFYKPDCGRLPQENSTLRNQSNFDTIENTVLDTQRKKFHPEDSQKMQHVHSHRQQKLQIPRPTSTTKLSHELSTNFIGVGIDYTGHLFIKSNAAEESKTYIAVFACCITGAVHEELVIDLTTEQFPLAFHRFCAEKSLPTTVVSGISLLENRRSIRF